MSAVYSTYRRVLTIAGSDSGGGAGLQADLKTCAALGCYGASAVTAITVQNTLGVKAVTALPADLVVKQIEAVLEDIGADVIKIGVLATNEIVQAVSRVLVRFPAIPVVLDPVLVAASGCQLFDVEGTGVMQMLFPHAVLVTPNLAEASWLVGEPLTSCTDLEKAAKKLLALGARAVLIKGGHLDEAPAHDCLLIRGSEPEWIVGRYVPTPNIHGTGCTYAAAIAAYLAHRMPLREAVIAAKRYLQQAITAGERYRLGGGHGPVHHCWEIWR